MGHAKIERYLSEAVAHVALGERMIERQRKLIATLESDGRDSAQARELLARFEEAQAKHLAERDRIQRELSATSS
jgi:Spy/CpxP family protein refolding chaperone